jgi:hypothetical protein
VIWPEAGASLRRAEAAFRLATQGRIEGIATSSRGQSSASTAGQSGSRREDV